MTTMLVTGGAGFIGSNFVRHALRTTDERVVVLDKLTYAGSMENLAAITDDPRFSFVKGDIADHACVERVFTEHRPSSVLNFAAESHVDRSIDSPRPFVDTNVVGAFVVLEVARRFWGELGGAERERFRFLHISTDEVYGSLGKEGLFSEQTPYSPNSPYAATKASADHLVGAYYRTYGLPVVITNCSNNYGPFQFPEKLIPLMTLNAIEAGGLPIYGDGGNVRDWIYVEDHCAGILLALRRGRLGEKYNIGGGNEKTNVEVVDTICETLEQFLPAASNERMRAAGLDSYKKLKTFVEDRKGHDRRYAIDATRIETELGWRAAHDFASGMAETVRWYLDNRDWCEAIQREGRYRRQRLGLADE